MADRRERLTSAAGVAALHALLLYALVAGLGVDIARVAETSLAVFDVPAPPPPPELLEPRIEISREPSPPDEGAPDLRAAASPVVAPRSALRTLEPRPVSALAPDLGAERDSGASDMAGPGDGAGGTGQGRGGGGDGDGAGSGSEIAERARRVGGRISESDYPRALKRSGAAGTVLTRYTVGPDGRVGDCVVTESSGFPKLDAHTCRLIEKRFRYRPARDAEGRAVADTLYGRHQWWTGR